MVIDAGHGGKDPGATGPGHTNEKDVALAVALKLGNYIKKNYPDINVIYTRKTDEFVELHERADIANRNKADLFIAIHCNSSPNPDAYGTSTYVLGLHRTEANLEVAKRENAVILLEDDRAKNYEFDPNSAEGHIIMSMKQNAFLDQSIDMASKMETQYENGAKRKSLGVKQAGFYVLYKTTMPSLLSEIGFISNPDEEKFLKSAKGQDEIAESIFSAFQEYKAGMESGTQPARSMLSKDSSETLQTEAKYVSVPVTDDYTTLNNGQKIKKPAEGSGGGGVVIPPVSESQAQTPQTTQASTSAPANPVAQTPVDPAPVTPPAVTKNIAPPPPPVEQVTPTPPAVTEQKIAQTAAQEPDVPAPTASAGETKPSEAVPAATEVIKSEAQPVKEETSMATPEPVNTPKKETVTYPPVTPAPKIVKTEMKPVAATSAPITKATKQPAAPPVKEAEGSSTLSFRLQLFSLKNPLKETDRTKITKLFKSIDAEQLSNGLTRYCVGNTSSFSEAKRMLATAISNGYTGSFIVGLKNGKRMTPDEMKALETQ